MTNNKVFLIHSEASERVMKLGNTKCYALLLCLGLSSAAFAECKITLTCNPSLPATNLVANPGFEEGDKSWLFNGNTNDHDGVTDAEKHSGKFSFRLVGRKGVSKGFRQYVVDPIEFNPPVPAGMPVTIRAWSKSRDTEFAGGEYGLAASVTYTNGSSSYINAPAFTKGPHGWMKKTTRHILTTDLKKIDVLYGGLYYDQTGEAWFDDLFLGVGWVKLTCRVEGPEIRRIRVFSEEQGLLYDTGVLAAPTNLFDKTMDAPLDDQFYAEAEDVKGGKYSARYPVETAPVIPPPGKGEISVFQRFPREFIKGGTEEQYVVVLPKTKTGQKILLRLKVRADHYQIVGGGCILQIKVNGNAVTVYDLMDRAMRFTFADGRDNAVAQGASVFCVYSSPDFGPIPDQNPYFPVDIPNNDPYIFQFDISRLVQEGTNLFAIRDLTNWAAMTNPASVKRPLVVEDALILIPQTK